MCIMAVWRKTVICAKMTHKLDSKSKSVPWFQGLDKPYLDDVVSKHNVM